MASTLPAEFLGTSLSIIERDGQRWLTAEQVGLAESDTGVIKLMTPGGEQSSRIFSASGCMSGEPTYRFVGGWSRAARCSFAHARNRTDRAVVAKKESRMRITRAVERQVFELFVAGKTRTEIRRALGISAATLSLLLRGKFQFSPFAGQNESSRELINAIPSSQSLPSGLLMPAQSQSLPPGLLMPAPPRTHHLSVLAAWQHNVTKGLGFSLHAAGLIQEALIARNLNRYAALCKSRKDMSGREAVQAARWTQSLEVES